MAGSLPQSGVQLVAQGVSGFLGDIGKAQRAVGDFGDSVGRAGGPMGAFGQVVTGALREIGAMATQALAEGARAVAGFVADSVGVAGDFEQTLNVLGATSGATAGELEAVSARAKELGADLTLPTTSATDAAEVMLELSKAGMSVQEAMDAAKGSLQLAAAAQVDGATAANIMSGALNAFELEATDAVRVTDLLAAGANASSASMTDLGQGLQQAGFAFNAAGLPVEDLVTSLAALTNVGLTGSDAGTALKNALMRLMNPTEKAAALMRDLGFSAYDTNGNMKQLPDIIADLNIAFAGMTDQQRNAALGNIFLSDGMKAMIPLLDIGEDGFLKLKDAVTQEGAAAAVAEAQTKGWNGATAAITSQLENLQLFIGQQLLPVLAPLGFAIAEIVGRLTAFGEAAMASGDPIGYLVAAIETALPGFTGMLTAIGSIGAALSGALPAGTMAGGSALTALQGILVGVVIPAVTAVATWFAANLPAAIAIAQAAFANISAFVATVMPAIQNIIAMTLAIVQSLWAAHGESVLHIVQNLWQAIQGVVQIVTGVIQGIVAVFYAGITGNNEEALETIRAANELIWSGIKTFLGGILQAIAGLFGTTLEGIIGLWASNFRKLGELAGVAMQAAKEGIVTTLSAIVGAFVGVTGAINGAITAVRNFIAAAARIVVPKLVTPGSPTPLELGLRGIDKAAGQAARTFEAAFSPALASVPAMPNMAAMAQPSTVTNSTSYTMPIYTNNSPGALRQSLAVVEALST